MPKLADLRQIDVVKNVFFQVLLKHEHWWNWNKTKIG